MIKKPQKHQEKIAGTLFKHPKVRKDVIKQNQAYGTI